jgi:hypothetical protein
MGQKPNGRGGGGVGASKATERDTGNRFWEIWEGNRRSSFFFHFTRLKSLLSNDYMLLRERKGEYYSLPQHAKD